MAEPDQLGGEMENINGIAVLADPTQESIAEGRPQLIELIVPWSDTEQNQHGEPDGNADLIQDPLVAIWCETPHDPYLYNQ